MLGREIKRLREERELTPHGLATALGMKSRDVERWEKGGRPTPQTIKKIERFFEFREGHLSNLPTTVGMKYEMVTYHDGVAVEYFATNSKPEARAWFMKNNSYMDNSIRVWKNGERLTYPEGECELVDLRDRACPTTIGKGAKKNG